MLLINIKSALGPFQVKRKCPWFMLAVLRRKKEKEEGNKGRMGRERERGES